ncbi:MAG: DUF2911 domain-containing protein [Bacteroidota bacterium]
MKTFISILFFSLPLFILPACGNKEKKDDEKTGIAAADTSRVIIADNKVNPYAIVDVSPMDISYFPVDYPKLKMADSIRIPHLFARIIYSRPHLQGRHLFTDLLKYGEPWRLGANESTELDLYTEATIQNKKIKAGRYVLYCIPQPDSWTIILNSNIDSWGLHPDPAKDIARFHIPVKQTANRLEYFTIIFEKTASGADIVMAWDNLEARLPVSF